MVELNQSIESEADPIWEFNQPLAQQRLSKLGLSKCPKGNPAWRADAPAYMTFAKEKFPADTVLGMYSGVVRAGTGPCRSDSCFDLVDGSAHIDAGIPLDGGGIARCNELAFVNDYRTN